jgi:3-oxoacyl-[acyl-carrier-protein] synthase-3
LQKGFDLSFAAVGPVAVHLPDTVETNEQLHAQFPAWDMDLIYKKTGVAQRHIAGPEECVSDLGVAAAEKLFLEHDLDRSSIDFLLFCTQTPDYPLPTTACMVQDRLKLRTTIGALDFNLGCSGYVYGLSLAEGLIRSGAARRVLLITAETYSKYINEHDRSLRTIFGDGAAATLIDAVERPCLSGFSFGTDGQGADMLMLTQHGLRKGESALKPRKRHRWPSSLYMDGPGLIYFTLEVIPPLIHDVLRRGGRTAGDVDVYLMHQPTRLLLEKLRETLKIDEEKLPMVLDNCGNTVSSTIPIVIQELRREGKLRPGTLGMMVGFGVGLSWAGCLWKDTWDGNQHHV